MVTFLSGRLETPLAAALGATALAVASAPAAAQQADAGAGGRSLQAQSCRALQDAAGDAGATGLSREQALWLARRDNGHDCDAAMAQIAKADRHGGPGDGQASAPANDRNRRGGGMTGSQDRDSVATAPPRIHITLPPPTIHVLRDDADGGRSHGAKADAGAAKAGRPGQDAESGKDGGDVAAAPPGRPADNAGRNGEALSQDAEQALSDVLGGDGRGSVSPDEKIAMAARRMVRDMQDRLAALLEGDGGPDEARTAGAKASSTDAAPQIEIVHLGEPRVIFETRRQRDARLARQAGADGLAASPTAKAGAGRVSGEREPAGGGVRDSAAAGPAAAETPADDEPTTGAGAVDAGGPAAPRRPDDAEAARAGRGDPMAGLDGVKRLGVQMDGNAAAHQITVERLLAHDVVSREGNDLGEARDVVRRDGKLFLVVAHGGFLGFGATDVMAPLETVSLREDQLVVRDLTAEELDAMTSWNGDGERLSGGNRVPLKGF